MAIKAIDLNETRDYVSKFDTQKPKTIWKLGVLDAHIRAELEDEMSSFEISSLKPEDSAKTKLKLNTRSIEVVRYGLKGFENFVDGDGKPVKFDNETVNKSGKSYQVLSRHILAKIPFKIIQELAGEIVKDNVLSEEERKN